MPHQIVEYSANLQADFDIDGLLNVLHQAAAGVDALPVAGLRTRAVCREQYVVADGHQENRFLHIVLRIAHGRSMEVKRAAGKMIFDALCAYVESVYNQHPLAISFEIQEIDPDLRWKKNNLRDYLVQRETSNGQTPIRSDV